MAVYVRVEEHYINTNPFTNIMPPEGLIALGNEWMKEFKAHISQRILVNLQNAHFGKITLIVLIQLQT